MRQTFSQQIFGIYSYVIFSSTKLPYLRTENSVLQILFLINQVKKYAGLCNMVRSQLDQYSVHLSICLTVWNFGVHTFQLFCQQETSHLAEVGLKLLPSLKTYMWNVSYYLLL